MKNLILAFLLAMLMVGCGDSSPKRPKYDLRPGNCFINRQYPPTYAFVKSLMVGQYYLTVEYTYQEPKADTTRVARSFKKARWEAEFEEIYNEQIDCSQYVDARDQVAKLDLNDKVVDLEQRVQKLENRKTVRNSEIKK